MFFVSSKLVQCSRNLVDAHFKPMVRPGREGGYEQIVRNLCATGKCNFPDRLGLFVARLCVHFEIALVYFRVPVKEGESSDFYVEYLRPSAHPILDFLSKDVCRTFTLNSGLNFLRVDIF